MPSAPPFPIREAEFGSLDWQGLRHTSGLKTNDSGVDARGDGQYHICIHCVYVWLLRVWKRDIFDLVD
jgi:hypothetical protein